MKINKSLKVMLFSALCAITLNACAEYTQRDDDHPPKEEYLPFAIKFDQAGNPVILDDKGRPVEAANADFPLHATAIEKIDSISYVQYRGSHMAAIVVGGKMFLIKLPH